MSDIVDRLRMGFVFPSITSHDAADEIERLRAQVARVEAWCDAMEATGDHGRFTAQPIREALAGEA